MVALLSELWRLAAYLLRPEDLREGGQTVSYGRTQRAATLAGLAKALLWTALSVAAGLALARLG